MKPYSTTIMTEQVCECFFSASFDVEVSNIAKEFILKVSPE